jgi:hypothetical protein
VTEFIGPIFDEVRHKIISVVADVPMPLIGNVIVVDKSKGDAQTASTASLQTLDTQASPSKKTAKKEVKKEDFDEFLKYLEK